MGTPRRAPGEDVSLARTRGVAPKLVAQVYPGPLKPTDELIAVNGKVILEPTEDRFKDLRKATRCAEIDVSRPLRFGAT